MSKKIEKTTPTGGAEMGDKNAAKAAKAAEKATAKMTGKKAAAGGTGLAKTGDKKPRAKKKNLSVKSSIFYAITFIFFLASASIFLAFFWLIQFDKTNYTAELNAKYSYLANLKLQEVSGGISSEEFAKKKQKFGLKKLSDERMREVLSSAVVLAEDGNQVGFSQILVLENKNYLYVRAGVDEWLYEDLGFSAYRYMSVKIILFIVLVVLCVCYVFVISKLRPLRSLRRQIDYFAAGEYSKIENIARGGDEISQVADAFFQAIGKIKDMNISRQFFLRNIMHELKTPITKGRITSEMLADGKFKDRLVGVFDRMVMLIDELAAIEHISSGIGKDIKRVSINHVFDEAKQMLLLEDESVQVVCAQNFSVQIDYKLFSTAVKNMLDNALKYSDDARVQARITPERIDFINAGKKLDKDLAYYIEPFTQGGNRASNSLGLGLYVVQTILGAHRLALEYRYEEGKNIFSFVNIENIKA